MKLRKFLNALIFFFVGIMECAAQTIQEAVPVQNLISKTKVPVRDKGLQYSIELGYNNALSSKKVNENISSGDIVKSFWAAGGNLALTYKFNESFSIGVGAGFHFLKTETPTGISDEEGLRHHHSGPHNTWDGTLEEYSEHKDICGKSLEGNRKDFFLRAMYRITDKKISPLISVDAGYRLYDFDGGISNAYDNIDDVENFKSTYFVSPSIGLSLRTTNNSYIELKAGYDFTPSIKEQNSNGEWGTLDKKYYNTTQYGKHVWSRHYDKINLSSFYVRLGFTHTLNLLPKKNYPKYEYNYSYFDSGSNQVEDAKVKELFDLAYSLPDTEVQKKYNSYMDVIKADPYNRAGYLALAYNNIGAIYENHGNEKKAIDYYKVATIVSPGLEIAANNLKRVKSARRSRKWDNIINNMSVVGGSLKNIGEQFSNQSGGNYQESEQASDNDYSTGNSSRSTTRNSSSNGKKVDANAIRNLERAYDGYETQLVKMKSSGNYSKDEVKSIQRKMKETREKYNKLSGRSRSVSSYETWNP